jgi:glycosyltransferase involved in cell wall biosynthesis
MSGPKNFMSRLACELSLERLPPHVIRTPGTAYSTCRTEKSVSVFRLDGLFLYKMTPASAYNFIRMAKFPWLPKLAALETMPPRTNKTIDRTIARYLNRHVAYGVEKSDVIVYQSLLSKAQHSFLYPQIASVTNASLIGNGVPLGVFKKKQLTKTLKKRGGLNVVITGEFRLGKRLLEGIKVINSLKRIIPKAKLHIIGPRDILTNESIREISTNSCVFHGKVPSENLPDYYATMDLGISPALFDPCPNSVIEMLACGLPVITTTASGASELVPSGDFTVPEDAKLGYTELHNPLNIPRVDTRLWCEKLLAVLSNRALLAQEAEEHARKNFDIKVIAKKYADLIIKTYDEKYA